MTLEQWKIAQYLNDRAKKLTEIALLNGFPVAAYCFDMAALETELAVRSGGAAFNDSPRSSAPNPRRPSRGAQASK